MIPPEDNHLIEQLGMLIRNERALGALTLASRGLGLAQEGIAAALVAEPALAPELDSCQSTLMVAGRQVISAVTFLSVRNEVEIERGENAEG